MLLLIQILVTAFCFAMASGFTAMLTYPENFPLAVQILIKGTFAFSLFVMFICALLFIWVF